ncbi:aminotransferase class I/II-fold pyridoxal phosphate-dependent enzyme [Amycolatopsis sp. NBC_01286]|uniref:aminotransferase class I/II-fold pyridoxal phosphate-dependent enzyme n=1 Tax=Amycolatopsis sp. NBC_01286 TaxID=2903560 RepID=UPI002E0E42B5|nr:aminotransferase class I/II-fold pyridoxal phosphate-dependent enzyme [Amycolatopsis sp. NBC_01286]
MDVFDKIHGYTDARDAIAAGLYPYFGVLDRHEGTEVRLAGKDAIMCGSNNYLGLTNDPRVIEASAAALAKFGTSCTGSRLLNGNLRLHEELEAKLAEFYRKEDALVFPTGFQANLGTISAIASRGDVVLLDQEAHASAIDAARLSGARVKFFRHNDAASLEQQLAARSPDAGVLVAVEGVYSMAGDICSLPEVDELARRYGARVLLDDAHGLGVLAGGRGTEAHFAVPDGSGGPQADLITVTFSKSLASAGGAVVGSREVIHYLRHHARSLIFSASMTPANTAAALAALRVLTEEPWRAERAQSNAAYVRRALTDRGVNIGASMTPIVPVPLENVLRTFSVWKNLLARGVYVNAVVPPAASCRLRMSFMATHTRAQLDHVVSAIAAELVDDVAEPTLLGV